MKNYLVTALVFIFAFSLSACEAESSAENNIDDEWGTVTIEPGGKIRIAVVTSNGSDIYSSTGLEHLRGIELAQADRGEVLGHAVEIIAYTENCSSGSASDIAEQITSDTSIVAVVGHSCTDSCFAAGPLYESSGYTSVSPNCGNSKLTDDALHSGSFIRLVYSDLLEGQKAAEIAYEELAARRVAIVYDGTENTREFIDAFTTAYIAKGGEISFVSEVASFEPDFTYTLAELLKTMPDVIYIPTAPEITALFAKELGDNSLSYPLIGSHYIWNNAFPETVKDYTGDIYALGPASPANETYGAAQESYLISFEAAPEGMGFALAYDALSMILESIETSSAVDPSGRLVVGRKALHDSLFSQYLFEGATGKLTCTEWGDCSSNQIAAGKITSGRWMPILEFKRN